MPGIRITIRKRTKGGPGSGNWGHSGRQGLVGGSSLRGHSMSIRSGQDWQKRYEAKTGRKPAGEATPKLADLSGFASVEHSKRILGNMSVLKGKFSGTNTYTDEEGVAYKLIVRRNNWTTGKDVAGTASQQRYNFSIVLQARDVNNSGWRETIMQSPTRNYNNWSASQDKDMENLMKKLTRQFGEVSVRS